MLENKSSELDLDDVIDFDVDDVIEMEAEEPRLNNFRIRLNGFRKILSDFRFPESGLASGSWTDIRLTANLRWLGRWTRWFSFESQFSS